MSSRLWHLWHLHTSICQDRKYRESSEWIQSIGNIPVFTDVEFAPSIVTERNLPVDQPEIVETQTASSSTLATQHQTNGTELPALNCPSPADKQQVGVTDISPLPQVSYIGARKRRAETSEVLTGTPYKKRLLESVTRKNVGCRWMLHADKNSTAPERTRSQSKSRNEQNRKTPSEWAGSKSDPAVRKRQELPGHWNPDKSQGHQAKKPYIGAQFQTQGFWRRTAGSPQYGNRHGFQRKLDMVG